jgi:hypothetical protein
VDVEVGSQLGTNGEEDEQGGRREQSNLDFVDGVFELANVAGDEDDVRTLCSELLGGTEAHAL